MGLSETAIAVSNRGDNKTVETVLLSPHASSYATQGYGQQINGIDHEFFVTRLSAGRLRVKGRALTAKAVLYVS